MTQLSKAEVIEAYRLRYLRSEKHERMRILDIITEATGYSRKHAIRLLNHPKEIRKIISRRRSSRYAHLVDTLRKVWAASNFICGKRLVPFLPNMIDSLKRHGEISLSKEDTALLCAISPATADRLLRPARKALAFKGRSTTKPGTLLKHKIPIRTFTQWNDESPGFLEIDLVAHCGDSTGGEYINTLNMTDVATGWTRSTAFMGRSERFCVAAIEEARSSLPFPVLGIDSDNDSVFINSHLFRYCTQESITFTRSRPYKKNDQCRIEQKNWDVVRKMIGYGRFETPEQLEILNRIHCLLSFYQNLFQPSRKVVSKQRIGAKVRKKYDIAQTPCQRLLSCKDVPPDVKKRLRETFRDLNPAQLLRSIQQLTDELYRT